MGIGLLLICAFVLWMCSTGVTPEDRDATAVVLLAPLGLWMLFTKCAGIQSPCATLRRRRLRKIPPFSAGFFFSG